MSGPLSEAEEALVMVSSAMAARRPEVLRRALVQATERSDAAEVEEVILQAYLFLGYPVALNTFALWREVSARPAGPADPGRESWAERGARVC
ncbi:MAG: hypothetical protein HKO53_15785, partial [Gemmatimonadetes bacterium]|nr:hypothetical protein [Gemmatimonadota bacterium]